MVQNENGVPGQHGMPRATGIDEGIYGFVYKRYHKQTEPNSKKSYRRLLKESEVYKLMFNCCMTLSASRSAGDFILKSNKLLQLVAANKIPADATVELFLGQHRIMSRASGTDPIGGSVFLFKTYPIDAEANLRESYQWLRGSFEASGLTYTLDVFNCCMSLSTNWTEEDLRRIYSTCQLSYRDMEDNIRIAKEQHEDRIRKSKKFLQLMALNIPAKAAYQIFIRPSEKYYIIKTGHQPGGLCSEFGINDEEFSERKRLLLDNKLALEEITACHIIIRDEIVVLVGRDDDVEMVRSAVEGCIARNEQLAPKIFSIRSNLEMNRVEAQVKTAAYYADVIGAQWRKTSAVRLV